jgi:hypothetical protein
LLDGLEIILSGIFYFSDRRFWIWLIRKKDLGMEVFLNCVWPVILQLLKFYFKVMAFKILQNGFFANENSIYYEV